MSMYGRSADQRGVSGREAEPRKGAGQGDTGEDSRCDFRAALRSCALGFTDRTEPGAYFLCNEGERSDRHGSDMEA